MSKITGLGKIVTQLIGSEVKSLVLSSEYSASTILINLAEKVSGVNISAIEGIENKLKAVQAHEVEIKKELEFSNGESKFHCVDCSELTSEELKVKVLVCIMEHEVKNIILEPNKVLLRTSSDNESVDWDMFKTAMERMYSVSFVTVEDDFAIGKG